MTTKSLFTAFSALGILTLSNLPAQTLWEENFSTAGGWTTAPLMQSGQPNTGWGFSGNGSADVVAANPNGTLNFTSGFRGASDQLTRGFSNAVNTGLVYTASFSFSNADFNGSTPDRRGNMEFRLQWGGGRTIGAVNISQFNGANASIVQFAPGDGGFNSALSAPNQTLSEALSGLATYRLGIEFTPATSTVGFSLVNTGTSAVVASDSGTVVGSQTNFSGTLLIGGGFLETDSSTFATSEWSVVAVPEPSSFVLLGLAGALLLARRVRKHQS